MEQVPPEANGGPDATTTTAGGSRKEESKYTYTAAWATNVVGWSHRKDEPFRLGIGSFLQEYSNRIDIVQLDQDKNRLVRRGSVEHCYPPTKLLFHPEFSSNNTDLFATTGDYLRLWSMEPDDGETQEADTTVGKDAPKVEGRDDLKVSLKHCLNNNKMSDFCAPLTSFDWNMDNANILATSSIDTTVSIWDIETQTPTTQLIAHDKDVFDVAFSKGTHIFASCGADGSCRVFDLRTMEHCTIVFEAPELKPLLRLEWNQLDPCYIATIAHESKDIVIIDVRFPGLPVGTLSEHANFINSIGWAPDSSTHLCSGAEDCRALIWDVAELPKPIPTCCLGYTAEAEVNNCSWSPLHSDWIAATFGNKVQLLHV